MAILVYSRVYTTSGHQDLSRDTKQLVMYTACGGCGCLECHSTHLQLVIYTEWGFDGPWEGVSCWSLTRGTPARSQKSTVSHLVDHMNHMFQCSTADILSSHLELWTLITKFKKSFAYLGWSRLLGKQSDFAPQKRAPNVAPLNSSKSGKACCKPRIHLGSL